MEDIFLPVLESAMVYACHYCKATGRSTVTATDMDYGWKYAARVTLGNKLGSFFPEIYEEESSDEEDDIEVVDDEDEPFTRYTGTDELYVKMNEVYDTWDQWEPYSPAEKLVKNAIDSQQRKT